jgi:phage gp29-like protein
MLVDPYGREITSTLTKPIDEMVGTVRVRDQWSTYPSVQLTPEKLAGIFKEADLGDILRQAELFEEMEEKDPILGSVLHTRRLAVQGLDVEILAASDSPDDKAIAEAFKENLEDLDLEEPILHLLDGIGKGIGTVEINWDLSEGQAWLGGMEWIPNKRWTFSEFSAGWDAPLPKLPRLLTDAEQLHGIDVPPFKVIYHRYLGRSGFPQRAGLLRGLAYYYLFKNYDIKDWVIFLEKYGQPLRLGKFTPGAGDEDKRVLREAIRNLGTDAGAMISDTTMLEILEAKTAQTSGDLYERAASYFDKVYQIGVLGQTATTEGTPGKLGNEDAREHVRDDILKADARALQKTLRWQMIWPWVGFNYGWDKKVPEIRFTIEEPEDLVALSSTHKTLVDMGVPIPLSFIQQKYGIPAPENGEEVLQPPAPPPAPAPGGNLQFKKKIPIGSRLVEISD